MKRNAHFHWTFILAALATIASSLQAQPQRRPDAPPQDAFPPPAAPPGFEGPGPDGFRPGERRQGPGGFGGVRQKTAVVKQFDRNGDGFLSDHFVGAFGKWRDDPKNRGARSIASLAVGGDLLPYISHCLQYLTNSLAQN